MRVQTENTEATNYYHVHLNSLGSHGSFRTCPQLYSLVYRWVRTHNQKTARWSQQKTVEADEVAPGGHGSGREEVTLGVDQHVPGSHQGWGRHSMTDGKRQVMWLWSHSLEGIKTGSELRLLYTRSHIQSVCHIQTCSQHIHVAHTYR